MASPEELSSWADEEASSYCPLGNSGIHVVLAAEAMTRGEPVRTVNERGHTRAREIAGKVLPWALAAGLIGANAVAAVNARRRY